MSHVFNNTVLLRYKSRLFMLTDQKKVDFIASSISTITSLFVNELQKAFFTKIISEKSSTKSVLIERKVI